MILHLIRKQMRKSLFCSILVLAMLGGHSYSQCTRSQVISNFNNIYLASAVSDAELAWTGSIAGCNPGAISALAQTRTLARINYFRNLAGLNNVAFDPSLESRCQQAALMMAANNQLNHTPPPSWQCYTAEGAAAAGNSNLALGAHSASAISLYMSDNGVWSVGHRRWILYSRALVFGHGSAMKSDVLQVFNTSSTGPVNTASIPYPVAGFFPAPLVPVQWSFSKSGADFSSATVQMTGPSGAVTLTLGTIENGYGDNTIVWTPTGIVTNSTYDVTYNVQVNNVKISGVRQTISYSVTICQPVHPPQCPAGKTWSDSFCGCMTTTGIEDSPGSNDEMIAITPFSENLRINITSVESGDARIIVFSLAGNKVEEKRLCLAQGENIILLNSSFWSPGTYVLVLERSNATRTIKKIIRQ